MAPGDRASFLRSLGYKAISIAFYPVYEFFGRSGSWSGPLVEALAPRPDERVLDVSINGWDSGLALARQFPTTYFVSLGKIRRASKHAGIDSLENIELLTWQNSRIPCPGASFDKVVSSLALNALGPEEKACLLREMFRVLRHGGTLHLADYDRPQVWLENRILTGASYMFGQASTQVHLDGTWVNMISSAGFVGVRRAASFQEPLARVSLIRARRS